MNFEQLFEDVSFRHAENSEQDVSGRVLERVITSPEPEAKNTVYVAVRTGIEDTSRGMRAAYANGCRVFVCRNADFAAKDATVLLLDEPERILGELAARLYGYPARELTVIGITGSAGKSSVAIMLAQLLRRVGIAAATLTTDGLSIEKRFSPHGAKVPDAAQIQGILREMADAGTEVAILELSAYQLRHFAANGIDFTAILLTDLFPEGETPAERAAFEGARVAKQRLLAMSAAVTVLPARCELDTGAERVLRFGQGGDFYAVQEQSFYAVGVGVGTRFLLCENGEAVSVALPLAGACATENALCAAALARAVGMTLPDIAEGLSHVRTFGRMECVAARDGRMVYIDSAYTPQALKRSLQYLCGITEHRLCVLLGSVGGRARERRAPLGYVACKYADYVYLTADDPDTEDPRVICEEMLAGMEEKERACILPDRHRAIARAIREMRQGDVLLLAGKGADAFQLVGGVRLPFCEAEIVKRALAEL